MRPLALISLLLCVAGCASSPGSRALATFSTSAGSVVSAAAVRSVQLHVNGPGALGSGGMILTDAGAQLAGGAATWALLADSAADFLPVVGASVTLTDFSGKSLGLQTLDSDAQGLVKLTDLPDGGVTRAVATFSVGGKSYRLSSLIGSGSVVNPVQLDPINTMLDARVRQIYASSGAPPAATMALLIQVWTLCNQAGVTADPADIATDRSDAEVVAALAALWTNQLATRLTDAADKSQIQALIAQLSAAVTGS